MVSLLLNFCLCGRGIKSLLFAFWLSVLLIPKVHFAQQLKISSPLPKLIVTSHYGKRIHPILGVQKFHSGIDLKSQSDTIKSILDGQVYQSGYNRQLGNFIAIKNGALEIWYAHLSRIFVMAEDMISAGEDIGITGNTGLATGEHLHLAIKINGYFINPLKFLKVIQNHN